MNYQSSRVTKQYRRPRFNRYADCYESFSPAEAFEGGYTSLDDMRKPSKVTLHVLPTKITADVVEGCIRNEAYFVFPNTVHTVCCLTLDNGFTVIGENACVSHENWDKEMGEQEARKKAIDKVWMLQGFLLAEFGLMNLSAGEVVGEAEEDTHL